MTDVYDAIIDASLTRAVRHQIAEFGVETAPAGITVIAMGRFGGREVNFSPMRMLFLIYRPADDADDGQANAFAKEGRGRPAQHPAGPTTLEPKIELDWTCARKARTARSCAPMPPARNTTNPRASTGSARRCCAPGTRPATLNWRGTS